MGWARGCILIPLVVAATGCDDVFGLNRDDAANATGAPVSWVKPFAQRHLNAGGVDTFSAQAGAGDAIVLQVACAGALTPSAVAVSAPGWTFTLLEPLLHVPGLSMWGATLGAIAPDSKQTTVTVSWTGSDCAFGIVAIGDEFANNDPRGGAVTFDGHVQTQGDGDCNGTVQTRTAGDAVWGACSANPVLDLGPGYTAGADDNAGDQTEYKLTSDPAGTSEGVTFVAASSFLLSAVTIAPR